MRNFDCVNKLRINKIRSLAYPRLQMFDFIVDLVDDFVVSLELEQFNCNEERKNQNLNDSSTDFLNIALSKTRSIRRMELCSAQAIIFGAMCWDSFIPTNSRT
jgi:hypothetical protein